MSRQDLRAQLEAWAKRRHVNPFDVVERWDERAAIMEYDAGWNRADAERAAFADVTKERPR